MTPDFSFRRAIPHNAVHMKVHLKTAFAVLAGLGLGFLVVRGLHGGQGKAPPAFAVSNIEVTDQAKYQKYAEASASVVSCLSWQNIGSRWKNGGV